ncbi:MAG: ferritin-like domain-containing protein [Gemmatimonadales bacterium]
MTTPKAKDKTLHELFVAELADAYDGEKQLIKALTAMAAAAQDPKLKAAFTKHLAETKDQVVALEEVFGLLDLKPKGKHCDGIAGIIEEGKGAIEEITPSLVRDAALVAGGRRAEHYEIAAYRSMIAMGEALGYTAACKKLGKILEQEEKADAGLTGLGVDINAEALEEVEVEA